VLANRDQLELAMLNLAVNARDAMEVEGEIRLTTRKEDDAIVLTVAGTRPGIAASLRERAFGPLSTTKAPGTARDGTSPRTDFLNDLLAF
jgi:signal transduction histidine kinase